MDMPISIADGVHSFLLGDELMLFSQQTGAMFRLNQSAALIWSCCEEGLNRQAIVAELVQTFNLPESAIAWMPLGKRNVRDKAMNGPAMAP